MLRMARRHKDEIFLSLWGEDCIWMPGQRIFMGLGFELKQIREALNPQACQSTKVIL